MLLLPGELPGFPAPAVAGVALVQQPSPAPKDPGGQGEEFGKAAPMSLVVVLFLLVAVVLLVRSMNKHLRRVPPSFDPPPSGPPGDDRPGDDRPGRGAHR